MQIIKNTSGYDTRAIRAVIVMAHNYIRKFEGRPAPNWSRLRVVVRGRDKGNHVTGCAALHGHGTRWDVCLTVPRPSLDARELLRLAHHELMHTYGYEHSGYVDISEAERAVLIPANYKMPTPAPKAKPAPADRKARRVASLIARRKQWQTRIKRAQTALTKIRKSLRLYERTAPALLAAYRERP